MLCGKRALHIFESRVIDLLPKLYITIGLLHYIHALVVIDRGAVFLGNYKGLLSGVLPQCMALNLEWMFCVCIVSVFSWQSGMIVTFDERKTIQITYSQRL